MALSSRHHHNPELLLRQFADPMFSDNIRVFEKKTGRWDPNRRTPNGVGWGRHLYSSWDLDGTRHDRFEQYLTDTVDTAYASVLKKAAVGFEELAGDDYGDLAHFIAFAAARSRDLMESAQQDHRTKRKTDDSLVKAWCELVGIDNDEAESKMLKDSLLRAIDNRASAWRDKLLSGRWAFLKAPRETPFITSDWPVFATTEGEHWAVTCAISSEVATLISNHPRAAFQNPGQKDVKAVNVRTMARATRFIVCPKDSFPGDEYLAAWSGRKVTP